MIYREFKTHAGLAPYVQLVWMMESEHEDDHAPKSLIVPDGIVEVVFHYGDPWITTVAGRESKIQPKSFAISQMRRCIETDSTGRTAFVSVRFFPWGAYHFFDKPVSVFLDDTVDTETLWPSFHRDLMEKLHKAAGGTDFAQVVQQFLLDRLTEYRTNDSALDKAVKLIRSAGGQLSIEEVGQRVGLSKKQLARKFAATVGTTPKTFARTSRFLNICHHLDGHRGKTLTQLAYECGYFDQAHFIREFTAFSGFTPKAFFAKNNVKFADM